LERFVASYFSQRERFLAAPSPAYLLDGQALRARALAFRRTFQELRHPCSFYFAVKSNNTPRVAAILLEEGFGLDVSGAPELEGALALGARDIIFSGPGKTAEELRLAAAHPEVTVLLDSFGELERLEGEAAARGRVVRAGVRLSPEAVSPWSKFGIPPEELPRFCREARSRPHVRLEGVQCHTSWNMSPRPQCRFLETIAGALENVDQKSREQLTFLDVGGGYWPERGEWLRDDAPSPDPLGHRLEPASPLAHYARDLSRTLGTHRSLRALGRLCFEPGRWICDDAMKFVAREQRRGALYNGIVLDPPSFGRGAQGQVWKIEDSIRSILENCRRILDTSQPYFILLSCHSQGFSPLSLGRCLAEVFPEDAAFLESGEMVIPEADSARLLPAGIYARLFKH